MAIIISKPLKKQIAEANSVATNDVEELLWSASAEKCSLCSGELNRSSDTIEVDHDKPEAEGGTHLFSNLRLVHQACNRYKRNNNTRDVAPLLKFRRYYFEKGQRLTFETAQAYFTTPTPTVHVSPQKKEVQFELPNGDKPKVPIFEEKVNGKTFRYCFVDLGIGVVCNDSEVQPRDVKLEHVFSISGDLLINPLHEQPACRHEGNKLLLFDGQHKALAKALNNQHTCTYKVYLDLSRADATVLVNSVQSKIKKLPLSPFELAAKLSDELRDKLERYQESVGVENASEEGFIDALDASARTRAKSSIEADRIDAVMRSEDLDFTRIIEMKGKKLSGLTIKESTFQTKVLKKLMHCKPLPASFKGEEMRQARDRETANVVQILNILYELVFTVIEDGSPTDEEKERANRIHFQGSLEYIAELLRRFTARVVAPTDDTRAFLEKPITEEQWATIRSYVQKMIEHPIWKTDLNKSEKTRAVQRVFSQNQGGKEAFVAVELTNGYCIGADPLTKNALG